MQCLGLWNSVSHSCNMSATGYGDGGDAVDPANRVNATQFCCGFDLEAIPHSECSGQLVSGGGSVQVTLKNVGDPNRAYIMTHFDAALELKSQGAIVYS